MGATELSDICYRLETAGKTAAWQAVENLMPGLSTSLQSVVACIAGLSRRAEETVGSHPAAAMAETDLSTLRALVVDDEKFMRQLVARVLSEMAITDVTMADDGQAAIEAVVGSDGAFDLVICDLAMPVMGGLEFIAALRALDDPVKRDIPVIILTGHPLREHVVAAAKLGISGFLVKPVSRGMLESRVRAAVTGPPADSGAAKPLQT